MKNYILSIFVLISNYMVSQTFYPLYSDVWRFNAELDVNGNGSVVILPKKEDTFNFSLTSSEYYDKNINYDEVMSHLLTSLNEFRSNYGSYSVSENEVLNESSSEHAKKISNEQVRYHSDLTKNPMYGQGRVLYEVVNGINKQYFYNVDSSYGDFNKIVADCIFDSFVVSKKHTEILLNNMKNYQVGFGVEFTKWGIVVVIQFVGDR